MKKLLLLLMFVLVVSSVNAKEWSDFITGNVVFGTGLNEIEFEGNEFTFHSNPKIEVYPRGDDELRIRATNVQGNTYDFPYVGVSSSGVFRFGEDNTEKLHFKESHSTGDDPNCFEGDFVIGTDDKFLLWYNEGDYSHVQEFESINVDEKVVTFIDYAVGPKQYTYEILDNCGGTGLGELIYGGKIYKFWVGPGSGELIVIDLNGDGKLDGSETKFATKSGHLIDLGEYSDPIVGTNILEISDTSIKLQVSAYQGKVNLALDGFEEVKCTDSDGGKNYYVKGYVDEPNRGKTYDSCGANGLLYETLCTENPNDFSPPEYLESYAYDCEHGCEDGVCLEKRNVEPAIHKCYAEIDNDWEIIDYPVEKCEAKGSTSCKISTDYGWEKCEADCYKGECIGERKPYVPEPQFCDVIDYDFDAPEGCKYVHVGTKYDERGCKNPDYRLECEETPKRCPVHQCEDLPDNCKAFYNSDKDENGCLLHPCGEIVCHEGEDILPDRVPKPPQTPKCNGCEVGDNCYDTGIRKDNGYCDVDGDFKRQKTEGESCDNDFECSTNECSSGECVDIQAELREQRGLIQSILDFLKKLNPFNREKPEEKETEEETQDPQDDEESEKEEVVIPSGGEIESLVFVLPDKFIEAYPDYEQQVISVVNSMNVVFAKNTNKRYDIGDIMIYDYEICSHTERPCHEITTQSKYYAEGTPIFYLNRSVTARPVGQPDWHINMLLASPVYNYDFSSRQLTNSRLLYVLIHELGHTYKLAVPEYYHYMRVSYDQTGQEPIYENSGNIGVLPEIYANDPMTVSKPVEDYEFGPLSVYMINNNLDRETAWEKLPSTIRVQVEDNENLVQGAEVQIYCIGYQRQLRETEPRETYTTDNSGQVIVQRVSYDEYSNPHYDKRDTFSNLCDVQLVKAYHENYGSGVTPVTMLSLQEKKILQGLADVTLTVNLDKPYYDPTLTRSKRSIEAGTPGSAVEIIQYCSPAGFFCKSYHENILPNLMEDYLKKGHSTYEYKHYFFEGDKQSERAAVAAECVRKEDEGVFLSYVDFITRYQDDWKPDETLLAEFASEFGINPDVIRECQLTSEPRLLVLEEVQEARDQGITSYPTTIINGKIIAGVKPYQHYIEAIENQSP